MLQIAQKLYVGVCAQADLRLCWLNILHCWKSHALAQIFSINSMKRKNSFQKSHILP